LKNEALYFKVNVEGTKAVIAAAVSTGVRKLVFTSSAGVVFNGGDLVNVDERLPYPDVPLDAYNDSKAKAEQVVLEANGKDGLLTVALRPAGIFGSASFLRDTLYFLPNIFLGQVTGRSWRGYTKYTNAIRPTSKLVTIQIFSISRM
jgi:nucleoside-diphosphate-sugar epimerase